MFLRLKKISCEKTENMRGFSLIELMVSLTIFSILMVVSVGTLLTLIDANAKAQALSSATTNLSFALDSITREIRTGHYYRCEKAKNQANPDLPGGNGTLPPSDCNNNVVNKNDGDEIIFIRDRDGFKIGYRLYGGKIQQRIEDPNGVVLNRWDDVTSSDIEIEKFKIVVSGSEVYVTSNSDTYQPVVTLLIKGKVTKNNGLEGNTDFNIQTLIVQRRLDQV